jgi:hypothetical protein
MAPENAHGVAMARWIEEGRQLFTLWQERVERLDELQGAAMAQEIDQLSGKKVRPSCWSGTNCDPSSLASAS